MDIWDTRRERLRELIKERFDGNQSALAERLSREANYISRLLTDKKHRKRMTEILARKIEKIVELPEFWLDQAHNQAATAPPPAWPFKTFTRAMVERLDPRDRDRIDKAISIMLSLCEGSRPERAVKKRAA